MSGQKQDRRRRYSAEDREQAVRLVRLRRTETGETHGSVKVVAEQLGFGPESARAWVNQADVEGVIAGTSSADAVRIKELEQEVRELRRSNARTGSVASFLRSFRVV